ncbi:hypothetical protein [Actinomadura macrotermitis]|uniref:Uncharacterized protein n=1 Tax=Actinomadura macrotermitis TaxID=2585200 RepID=A0A7K0BVH8_9ACTN|nr:hypothetical protein [Actinomadura macrotermitis]MQY05181.1 hypothetical protein [Actinomadura macrotermitis]
MKVSVARAVDRGVIFAATVMLACKQYGFPSERTWDSFNGKYSFVLIGLIVIAGFFGLASPFESFTQRLRIERRVVMRRHILTAFGQLLEICKAINPPNSTSDLGLHFWQKKRTVRHPLNGELVRISTYRLGAAPATRKLRPRLGVGVVGLCWKYDQETGVNVEEVARSLVDRDTFESFRDQKGVDAVMGFTWEEFQRYSHRGAVFASPVRNARSRFVGCVSFDVSRGYDDMDVQRVWHVLNSLSFVLGQDGFEDA